MTINYKKFKAPIFTGLIIIFIAVFPTEWFNLYDVKYFDKLMHFSGGVISAWFFSIFLRKELVVSSKFRATIIIVSIAGLTGILWEFAEYVSIAYVSQIAPTIAQYVFIGDLTDTLGDILVDLTGGLSFAIFYFSE